MLVEINLLQKKDQKKKSLFLLIILFVMLFSLLIWVQYQMNTIEEEIKKIEQQTTQIEQERTQIEKELPSRQESNIESVQTLKELVNVAKEYPIHTVDLLNRLTQLLPENGYFESFQYNGDTITLTIHIKQEMEAAFYYRYLLDEEWTEDVLIVEVHAIRNSVDNLNTLSQYTAQYEIKLNKPILKKLQKEESE